MISYLFPTREILSSHLQTRSSKGVLRYTQDKLLTSIFVLGVSNQSKGDFYVHPHYSGDSYLFYPSINYITLVMKRSSSANALWA